MFPCLLTRDDNDEFGDLIADGPFAELGHDLLDVGFHLVVGCDWGARLEWQAPGGHEGLKLTEHVETILLHTMVYRQSRKKSKLRGQVSIVGLTR